jgi:hypothetical protein
MKKTQWIINGISRIGNGHGGFGRRERANIPRGTRIKLCNRKPNGARVIQTEYDEYFYLYIERK